MKKTQRIELLRSIKNTGVSFFAVAFIAATSIAIYSGIQFSAAAIEKAADRYMNHYEVAHFSFSCANGITGEDVEALKSSDLVTQAEGGYSAMATMLGQTENLVIQVRSMGQNVNLPMVVEGRMPEGSNEIGVEQIFAEKEGISVGDTLTLAHDGMLYEEEFVVAGIVNDPTYCCLTVSDSRGTSEEGIGAASYCVVVAKDAFDASYYNDCYTAAYAVCGELEDTFYYSEEYTEKSDEIKKALEAFGNGRGAERYISLKEEADTKIADAEIKIADAEARTELEDSRTELAQAKAYLAEARENAAAIEEKSWIVGDRHGIGDIRSISMAVSSIHGLSYSFAVIFLIVAIVICYASIVRMIDEKRVLIGAQKALGFTDREIMKHFMWYNVLCAMLGIFIGLTGAVVIVETMMLYSAYAHYFIFNSFIRLTFVWGPALLASAICFVVFITATYVACSKLVRMDAVVLLRGEMPSQGKHYFFEEWKSYQKFSLYVKTMIKNVLHDKGRAVVTIMGVVGSISLLVICFSLKLALSSAGPRQYEQYFHFEEKLIVNSETANVGDFEAVLNEYEIEYAKLQEKVKVFRVGEGAYNNVHIISATDEDALLELVKLEDIETKELLEIPEEGILVSRRCQESLGMDVGSQVEALDSEGNPHTFTVVGIIEHYLSHHLFYVNAEHYEAVMGESLDESVFFVKSVPEAARETLREMEGFLQLRNKTEDYRESDSVNIVIAINLTLSAVVALLVLLNQGVMHINRKSRELVVMRINGFTLSETRAFIYKDTIVLTIIGLLLGSCFGVCLSYVVIRFVENDLDRFVRSPNILACLYACGVGALFALIVNVISLRKVGKLNLTNVSGN